MPSKQKNSFRLHSGKIQPRASINFCLEHQLSALCSHLPVVWWETRWGEKDDGNGKKLRERSFFNHLSAIRRERHSIKKSASHMNERQIKIWKMAYSTRLLTEVVSASFCASEPKYFHNIINMTFFPPFLLCDSMTALELGIVVSCVTNIFHWISWYKF